MATRNQSDAIRQELNGAWQQISGAFNFTYTSIAGFPRLLLHHDGSLYVLAGTGAILWLKPEYQINGGAWTDSGWGPDGAKFTFPAGWDETISLHCNRPCFPTAYPAGTVINTRVMARCSGSIVLCDSLLVPQAEAIKTWMQSESYQWNESEDDISAIFEIVISNPVEVESTTGTMDYAGTWCLPLPGGRIAFVGRTNPDKIRVSIAETLPNNEYNFGTEIEVNPASEESFIRDLVKFSTSSGRIGVCHGYNTIVFETSGLVPSLAYENTSDEDYKYTLISSHAVSIPGTDNIIQLVRNTIDNTGRLRIASVEALSMTEYPMNAATIIDANKEDFDDCAAYIGESKAIYAIKLRAVGEIGLYLTVATISGVSVSSVGNRVFPAEDGPPLAIGGINGKFVLTVSYEGSAWLLFGHISGTVAVIDDAVDSAVSNPSKASVRMYDASTVIVDIDGNLFAYNINTRSLIASATFDNGGTNSIANVVLDDGAFILPSIGGGFSLSRLIIEQV